MRQYSIAVEPSLYQVTDTKISLRILLVSKLKIYNSLQTVDLVAKYFNRHNISAKSFQICFYILLISYN